jgi:hypothetical protein
MKHPLIEKYPLLFSSNEMEPISMFGLEIREGWIPFLEIICKRMYCRIRNFEYSIKRFKSELEKELSEENKSKLDTTLQNFEEYKAVMPVIQQVKEKFGTLRIYVSNMDPYMEGLIDMAEEMSEHICEECGNKGLLYTIHWNKTLCEKHADERYGEKAKAFRERIKNTE